MFGQQKQVCEYCKLILCKCPTAPDCDTAEDATEPQSLEDFTAKTHADLARLVGECRNEWRFVAHPTCSDSAPCRHCGTIRNKHRLINDHLDQLETATLEAVFGEAS